MPITIRVDQTLRLRYAEATGVVTDADVIDGYAAALDDPAYDPTHDVVFDCSRIERVEVTGAAVRRMAELMRRIDLGLAAGVRPKVAIVAPTTATFGLARMYEAYRGTEESRRLYFICRTTEEARRWLGLTTPSTEPERAESKPPAAPRVVPVWFRDAAGARWKVEPRLFGRGPDALPTGFQFTSERGERRYLALSPREFLSPHEVSDDEWRALLQEATVEV